MKALNLIDTSYAVLEIPKSKSVKNSKLYYISKKQLEEDRAIGGDIEQLKSAIIEHFGCGHVTHEWISDDLVFTWTEDELPFDVGGDYIGDEGVEAIEIYAKPFDLLGAAQWKRKL